MSRKGDGCYNAPMESVNGTLKVEGVHDEHFKTREHARLGIVEYVATTTPSAATRHSDTSHRRNSSDAGAPGHAQGKGAVAVSATALPTDGRFRFVASDRTGSPWITLFALRGVH
jgi:hypothetical protein